MGGRREKAQARSGAVRRWPPAPPHSPPPPGVALFGRSRLLKSRAEFVRVRRFDDVGEIPRGRRRQFDDRVDQKRQVRKFRENSKKELGCLDKVAPEYREV